MGNHRTPGLILPHRMEAVLPRLITPFPAESQPPGVSMEYTELDPNGLIRVGTNLDVTSDLGQMANIPCVIRKVLPSEMTSRLQVVELEKGSEYSKRVDECLKGQRIAGRVISELVSTDDGTELFLTPDISVKGLKGFLQGRAQSLFADMMLGTVQRSVQDLMLPQPVQPQQKAA